MSKYVWELKQNNKVPIIALIITRKVYWNSNYNFCILCLIEKLLIIKFSNQDVLLNKHEVKDTG